MKVKRCCPVCSGKKQVVDRNTQRLRNCVFCKSEGWILMDLDKIRDGNPTAINILKTIEMYQEKYLRTRDIADLRPMRLLDIAEILHVHAATVYLSIKGKMIGDVVVRELFCRSLSGKSNKLIMQMIKNRMQEHPGESDNDIRIHLLEHDIDISRRTVTKYRLILKNATTSSSPRQSHM